MISTNRVRPFAIILLPAAFLAAGCGNRSGGVPGDGNAKAVSRESVQEEISAVSDSPAEQTESEISRTGTVPRAAGESSPDESYVEVDWGREVGLEEMVAMARRGDIKEIQWHVMPNILRAQATDGSIFHLRNENKGVDLRNTLIEAGVRIGKGGVLFRHVF